MEILSFVSCPDVYVYTDKYTHSSKWTLVGYWGKYSHKRSHSYLFLYIKYIHVKTSTKEVIFDNILKKTYQYEVGKKKKIDGTYMYVSHLITIDTHTRTHTRLVRNSSTRPKHDKWKIRNKKKIIRVFKNFVDNIL